MKKKICLFGLVFILLLGLLPGFVHAADIDEEVLEALERGEEVPVIVLLQEDEKTASDDLEQVKEAVAEKQDDVLNELNLEEKRKLFGLLKEDKDFELEHRYSTINAFSGEISGSGIEKLAGSDKVEKIVLDKEVSLSLDASVPLISANNATALVVYNQSIDGSGETICVIDTGIDYTHPAFGGCTNESFLAGGCAKVVGGYDFGDKDNDPMDINGHGTHVAGIAASENETYRGVAPGARLAAVKVFPSGFGSTNESTVIAGIDWCRDNAQLYNISIMTLSLGDGLKNSESCDSDILAEAVNLAVGSGIFVDVSSGNEGFIDGISSPACASNATSVGNVDKNDAISGSSNSGQILDLLAPGTSITSTYLNGGFQSISGTSMAAPHVAGAAALINQYNKLVHGSALSPLEIKNILKGTGRNITDERNGLAFARIDVFPAVISLDNVTPVLNFLEPTPQEGSNLSDMIIINVSSSETLDESIVFWHYLNSSSNNSSSNNSFSNNSSSNETIPAGASSFQVFKSDMLTGNNSFWLSVSDFAGNSVTTEEISFFYDGKPLLNITNLNNQVVMDSIILSVIARDVSNISKFYYNITNEAGILMADYSNENINAPDFVFNETVSLVNLSGEGYIDGTYYFTSLARDIFGEESVSFINFIVDKTVPVFFSAARSPEIVYNNDTVIFSVNVSDSYLNTTSVFFTSDFSGSWTNYTVASAGDTYSFVLYGEGNLTNQGNVQYKFYAADLAGNAAYSDAYNFTVQNRAPLNINITSPADGAVVELGGEIQFNGTAEDYDGDNLTYSWSFADGSSFAEGQNPSYQFNTTGSFVIVLNVSDSYVDVLSNATITVNDSVGPTFSSVSYTPELHLERDGNTQTVTATVSDYSGVSNVSLMMDNELKSSTCLISGNSWECSWEFRNMTINDYSFIVTATDNSTSGNSMSAIYSFEVTSCSDSSENGNEDDVDCGGSCLTDCQSDSGSSSSSSSSSSSGGSEDSSSDSGSSSSSSSGGGGGGGSSTKVKEEVKEEVKENKPEENVVELFGETSDALGDESEEVAIAEENAEAGLAAPSESAEDNVESSGGFLTGAAIFGKVSGAFANSRWIKVTLAALLVAGAIVGLYLVSRRSGIDELS